MSGLMSIRVRILALVFVPLIAVIIFSIIGIKNSLDQAGRYEILVPLATVSEAATEVIHHVQIERGRLVGFLSSGRDPAAKARVDEQRLRVDAELEAYRNEVAAASEKLSIDETMLEVIESPAKVLAEIMETGLE